MVAATDKAVTPISTAGKRWDNRTPSRRSKKNKKKQKQKQKQNQKHNQQRGGNVTPSTPVDSYAHSATAAIFPL
jgi:hypothetical protein